MPDCFAFARNDNVLPLVLQGQGRNISDRRCRIERQALGRETKNRLGGPPFGTLGTGSPAAPTTQSAILALKSAISNCYLIRIAFLVTVPESVLSAMKYVPALASPPYSVLPSQVST